MDCNQFFCSQIHVDLTLLFDKVKTQYVQNPLYLRILKSSKWEDPGSRYDHSEICLILILLTAHLKRLLMKPALRVSSSVM